MDIALDSNILIKDLWFKSQLTRVVFDYVQKTDSSILLSQVVIQETDAFFKRQTIKYLLNFERASREAKKHFIDGIPQIDQNLLLQKTYSKWKESFEDIIEKNNIEEYESSSSVLAEAMRRSIERMPPCKETGEGMRDAIIWLSLLEYCKNKYKYFRNKRVAFISENIKDFTGNDSTSLHPMLQSDFTRSNIVIEYYPSLKAFIESHIEPLSHITLSMIESNIDKNKLYALVSNTISAIPYSNFFRMDIFKIEDDNLNKAYFPSDNVVVDKLEMKPEDIKVYEFRENNFYEYPYEPQENKGVEASIFYAVNVEAMIDCQSKDSVMGFSNYEGIPDEYISAPICQRLYCIAHVEISISVNIIGNRIELMHIERMHKL